MYTIIEVEYDSRGMEYITEILTVFVANEVKEVRHILDKAKAVQEGLSAEAEATLEWEGDFDPDKPESWIWGREVESEALIIGYCIKVPDATTRLEA